MAPTSIKLIGLKGTVILCSETDDLLNLTESTGQQRLHTRSDNVKVCGKKRVGKRNNGNVKD